MKNFKIGFIYALEKGNYIDDTLFDLSCNNQSLHLQNKWRLDEE